MSNIKVIQALLFAFALFLPTACDQHPEGSLPLRFEKSNYELPLHRISSIMIMGGSRDYSLAIDRPDMLQAEAVLDSEIGFGDIKLTPLKKGETTLTVTDNVTGMTETLHIKITDNYLGFHILKSNHPALKKNIIMYLIANDTHDCYFLIGHQDALNGTAYQVVATGHYEFRLQQDTEQVRPQLTLTYASDENGFTHAETAPQEHVFDISGNEAFKAIERFLEVDWENLTQNVRNKSQAPVLFTQKETGTDFETISRVIINLMPEGILE